MGNLEKQFSIHIYKIGSLICHFSEAHTDEELV